MSDDTVCVECFADDFLRELVRREGRPSGDEEECSFCRAVGEPCIPAEDLAERFEAVALRLVKPDQEMELRQQEGSGDTLGDLFRDSLGTLNPDMDEPDELVRTVLGKHWQNVHQDDFKPDLDASWILAENDWTADDPVFALTTLRTEVLQLGHSLHFGPGKRVALDGPISGHAHDLVKRALALTEVVLEPGTKLYRARVDLDEGERARVEQFHAAPVKLAKAARANLQGERVWYLARELETARAELRPGRASEVSVVELVLKCKLRLCGLDQRLLETSPFEDLDRYVNEKAVADVANAMGNMFAKPIRPTDADTEYLVTQFLARMIREDGFDGIAYPSSQHADGLNYALFDPTLQCDFGPVQTYECERVSYTWSEGPLKRRPARAHGHDDDGPEDEQRDYDEETFGNDE